MQARKEKETKAAIAADLRSSKQVGESPRAGNEGMSIAKAMMSGEKKNLLRKSKGPATIMSQEDEVKPASDAAPSATVAFKQTRDAVASTLPAVPGLKLGGIGELREEEDDTLSELPPLHKRLSGKRYLATPSLLKLSC